MKQAKQKTSDAAVPIMDAEAIGRALQRIAHEIVERNPQLMHVVLAGIPSRGVKINIETGVIDVAMHRDDVGTRSELPIVRESKLPLPLEERTVIVVDDVLYTGRTVRAAMDAINSFGRPARIQLAVLIDRGHRELPIRPDYVGKNLPTSGSEKVRVRLEQTDRQPDEVRLEEQRTHLHDHTLDTKRFGRPARTFSRGNQFHSRNRRRIQTGRYPRDQESAVTARKNIGEFLCRAEHADAHLF